MYFLSLWNKWPWHLTSVSFFSPCFLVLGVEFRAWSLLGLCSTAWAMPPALFALTILAIGSHFAQASLFMLSAITRMAGTCHYIQPFSIEMESHKCFCLSWPGISILPISTSLIAWDNRCSPLHPAVGWDGISLFTWPGNLPDLSLQESRIAGVSHWCQHFLSFKTFFLQAGFESWSS
jgi:hypothetical protein